MDVHEFLKYFLSFGRMKSRGVLSETYNDTGVPWEFRYQLAEKTIGIDFGCDFKRGRCIKERNDGPGMIAWLEDPSSNVRVNYCCSQCYQTVGNLSYLPNNDKIIEEIASLFDPELRGFWRQGVGCTLPHRYRSTICLTGRCSYLHKTSVMDKEDLLKLYQLSNIRTLWRKQCLYTP